jgi:hypothetical protein
MGTQQSNMEVYDAALGREIEETQQKLLRLQGERHALRCDAAGVKVGDIVRVTRHRKDVGEGIIREIEPREWAKIGSKPWLKVSLKKKDGTFSKAVINAFGDWERLSD